MTDNSKHKRKQDRRERREGFKEHLTTVDKHNVKERNSLMTEICKSLKKTTEVFEARWNICDPLTIEVVKNTPLFWFKKNKWGYKDVKELYKICSIYKQSIETDLSIVYTINREAKERKRIRKAHMQSKHLHRESIANLRTLRDNSLSLIKHRSLGNVFKDESKNRIKMDESGLVIWQLLSKSKPQPCEQLNYDQFNIGLNDNEIRVAPDLSLDLFYEIFHVMQKLDKHNHERNKRRKKLQQKNKERRAGGGESPINSALLINIAIGKDSPITPEFFPNSSQLTVIGPNSPNTEFKGNFPQFKDEEKELTSIEKQKFIKKKTITMSNIQRLVRFIAKNVKREDLLTLPKNVNAKKKYLVMFHKIFDNIKNQQPFDIENDYLAQRLTSETLNNYVQILEILETRNADWKDRLQVLEYLESNLENNESLAPFFEYENCLHLIVGWTSQMYDARSNLTKVAAELFPSLLSQLVGNLDLPAVIFEEEHQLMRTIFEALFVLLKNGRSKTLSDIAHDVLIEIVDMLSMIARDLDSTAYFRLITLLHEKAQYANEKHDKVRNGCMIYILFILYGTEDTPFMNDNDSMLVLQKRKSLNDISSKIEDDFVDDAKIDDNNNVPTSALSETKSMMLSSGSGLSVSSNSVKKNVKMSKQCKRPFLFENEEFMNMFAKTVEVGVEDRSKGPREGAMKIMKKIESAEKEQSIMIFDRFFDRNVMGKYEKWKKYNMPKKRGKNKKKKRQKINRRAFMNRTKTVPHTMGIMKKSDNAKSLPEEEEGVHENAVKGNQKNS